MTGPELVGDRVAHPVAQEASTSGDHPSSVPAPQSRRARWRTLLSDLTWDNAGFGFGPLGLALYGVARMLWTDDPVGRRAWLLVTVLMVIASGVVVVWSVRRSRARAGPGTDT